MPSREPAPADPRLRERARRGGVLTEYRSTAGRRVLASGRALATVLRLLEGGPGRREPAGRVRTVAADQPSRWTRRALGLPEGTGAAYSVRREDGRSSGVRRIPESTEVIVPSLPVGMHELRSGGAPLAPRTWLLARATAPRRSAAWAREARTWGVFAPLYAMRSASSWGCGDFSSLATLVRWAAARGASVLGTLPLLSAPIGRAVEASPYAPDSRCAWNEVYIDPAAEREFGRIPRSRRDGARVRGDALERAERVAWEETFALKREILAEMYESFSRSAGPRRREFERFVSRRPIVREYSVFREGAEARAAVCRAGRVRPMSASFHQYAQWLADRQLRRVRRVADRLGVRLYFDLPLGIHPDGFDARRSPTVWIREASVGAPPDSFHPGGQSWGLPPPHPGGLRESGYGPIREALRHHFAVAPILRVDHAMGLHRLFWVPAELSAVDGVYVRYPADEQYAVYGLEADRAGGSFIGEDLGTVPPDVRPALRRHGWLGSYVLQLEWDVARGGRARRMPACSLASVNTHDLPPFAAFWARQQNPSTRSEAVPRAVRNAGSPGEALRRVLALLARGPALVALVNIEDLWDESRPQNVPGTGPEFGNFSRRCTRTLEEISRDADIAERLTHIARWRPKVSPG